MPPLLGWVYLLGAILAEGRMTEETANSSPVVEIAPRQSGPA